MFKNRNTPPPLDRLTVEWGLTIAPEKCPNPADTEREIWMKAGERRLALKLQAILQKQETTDVRT